MHCARNEVSVRDEAVEASPSTVHFGDLFECPKCGHQIIIGFGAPIADPSDKLLKEAWIYKHIC
jgi:hypothetical protein